MNPSDAVIRDLLRNSKVIAVVGMSPDSSRASFGVSRFLISEGYELYGVNPSAADVEGGILGRPCFANLKEVRQPVDIVDVFRKSDAVPAIVEEVLRLFDSRIKSGRAPALWLQEGVTHAEAEAHARAAGLVVVSDRCILKEHRRLL